MRTNEKVIKTINACFVTNPLFPISMSSFIHKFKLLHTFLSATDCIYISLNNWKALDHTISLNKINLAYDESHMSFLCSVDFSVVMLTSSCDYACRLLNLKKKLQRKPLSCTLYYFTKIIGNMNAFRVFVVEWALELFNDAYSFFSIV